MAINIEIYKIYNNKQMILYNVFVVLNPIYPEKIPI